MNKTVQIQWNENKKTLVISFTGRLDSLTATPELEKQLKLAVEGKKNAACIVDAEKLAYISSAGIRILMFLAGQCRDIRITGVSLDIYDILSMTGIANLMPVERRIRRIRQPVAGDLISRERDGEIYRDTQDLVIKVFQPGITLEEVQRRWKLSKTAMSYGIPTPIVFEVVSVGDSGYGIIYENVHGRTLAELWREQPGALQDETRLLSELMRTLHRTVIEQRGLPDAGERFLREVEQSRRLDMAEKKTLTRLAGTLHPADYFIFGNLRLDNILVRDGKLYIKDLTRCGRGNPVLDLQMAASAMNADGHGAFWTRLFARYTEGFTQEFRTRLEHELQPQIGPWW